MGGDREGIPILTRYSTRAASSARRLAHVARRLAQGVEHALAVVAAAMWAACATLCAATMGVVFVVVTLVGAAVTVRSWRGSGLTVNAACVAVFGIVAVVTVSLLRSYLQRREDERTYDLHRPWLPTAEQAQADVRLRAQVARYAEQRRRTAAVTTGEHAAVGRLP